MCNFCCKFASDFNMRGPIGRAEPYRTLMLQDGWKPTGRTKPYRTLMLQDGWKPTGRAEPYRTGRAVQDC